MIVDFSARFVSRVVGSIVLISGPARPGRLARLGGAGPELTHDPNDPNYFNFGYSRLINYFLDAR